MPKSLLRSTSPPIISPRFVICSEHGEERLLTAVERGVMPASIAMEIARAPSGDVQQALAEAHEAKLLPGNQILAIRRIILRATFGDIIQDTRSFDE